MTPLMTPVRLRMHAKNSGVGADPSLHDKYLAGVFSDANCVSTMTNL